MHSIIDATGGVEERPGEAAVDILVQHRGLMVLSWRPRVVAIYLHPGLATASMIRTAIDILGRRPRSMCRLNYFAGGWRHVLLATDPMLVRLVELWDDARPRSPRESFRSRATDKLPGALDELVRLWRPGAPLSEPMLRLLGHRQLRFMIADRHPDDRNLRIRMIARDGFIGLDHAWLSIAPGLSVQDQPDYVFGQWIAAAYVAALEQGAPCVEDVDVRVWRPNAGAIRSRYKRVILPLDAGRTVMSVTSVDRMIDLCG